jgi:hypothetical protein
MEWVNFKNTITIAIKDPLYLHLNKDFDSYNEPLFNLLLIVKNYNQSLNNQKTIEAIKKIQTLHQALVNFSLGIDFQSVPTIFNTSEAAQTFNKINIKDAYEAFLKSLEDVEAMLKEVPAYTEYAKSQIKALLEYADSGFKEFQDKKEIVNTNELSTNSTHEKLLEISIPLYHQPRLNHLQELINALGQIEQKKSSNQLFK